MARSLPATSVQHTGSLTLPGRLSGSQRLQAGMTIVPVGVDAQGNINVAELKQKAEQHK